jgi:hypothetical protein
MPKHKKINHNKFYSYPFPKPNSYNYSLLT